MSRTTSRVEPYRPEPDAPARPALFINDRPWTGLSYMTYRPDPRPIGQFADAGCPLFFFSITPDDCMYEIADRTWTGPGEYDDRQIDERLELFARSAPDGWLLPRVYMTSPPWWDELHPDEMVVFDDGAREKPPTIDTAKKRSYPSLASEPWRRATIDNLQRMIRRIEDGPFGDRVVGYHVASQHTEEWFAFWIYKEYLGDYSTPALGAWRRWLRERYRDDDAIRAAWGRDKIGRDPVGINTAPIPSGDERRRAYRDEFRRVPGDQPSIDYALFFSDLVVETLDLFAAAAKEACGRRKVVGAFYGYLLQFGEHLPVSGHLAVDRLLDSPAVDFLCSPSAYIDRDLGDGYAFFMGPAAGVHARGKLWINENDIGTWPAQVLSGNAECNPVHEVRNNRDSRMTVRREVANSLCHGAGMWWFDFYSHWYDEPGHMREVEATLRLGERLRDRPLASVSEILLVVDERSAAAQGWRSLLGSCLARIAPRLGHVGAPFEVVETADLDRVLAPRHRLVIFANAWSIEPARREAVRGRLNGSGIVALWMYAPCAVPAVGETAADAAQRSRELTGFAIDPGTGDRIPPPVAPIAPPPVGGSPFVRRWAETAAALAGSSPLVPDSIRSEGEPTPLVCVPPLLLNADETVVLADDGAGEPVLAVREMDGWTSAWCAAPLVEPGLFRALAATAGVHLYVDTGDTVYANADLVCVAATHRAGRRVLRLPTPSLLHDVYSGEELGPADRFEIAFDPAEVRLWEQFRPR